MTRLHKGCDPHAKIQGIVSTHDPPPSREGNHTSLPTRSHRVLFPVQCSRGQVLHGSATTTEAVRRAIQAREESVRALAKRYGISPTTVQKWRKRTTVADERMGPKQPRSTVLSIEEEAVVVAFRRHTLLPLEIGRASCRERV